MDVPRVYTTASGSVFVPRLIAQVLRRMFCLKRSIFFGLNPKVMPFPCLLGHHHLAVPYSPYDFALHVSCIAVNIFYLAFRTPTSSNARFCARQLSLIYMIPVIAGGHLNLLAELPGSSLHGIHRMHRCAALMMLAHLGCYLFSLVSTQDQSVFWGAPANACAVIVCAASASPVRNGL